MVKAFGLSDIESEFKIRIEMGIACRNKLSHTNAEDSDFNDEFTDTHLRNFKRIANYLSSICPAAAPYYEKYCNHFDNLIPQYVGHNTYSISYIKEKLFPALTEKEILHACIECGLTIADKAVRATKLEDVQIPLSEYFRKPYSDGSVRDNLLLLFSQLFFNTTLNS